MFVSCYILRVCVSFQSYAYGDLDEQAATSCFFHSIVDKTWCGNMWVSKNHLGFFCVNLWVAQLNQIWAVALGSLK